MKPLMRPHGKRHRRLVAGLLLLPCCTSAPRAWAPPRPNFVLIVADDQGLGELSSAGHPYLRTPALDALAQDGLLLERFYAASPVCSPTRASLLTGRHPCRTGTFAWGHELPAQERTFAEALAEEGYATGHFGKWHLGSLRAGAPTSPGAQGFGTWASCPNFFDLDPLLSVQGQVVAQSGEGSDVVTSHAIDFLRGACAARQPFALVLWFGSPHVPHAGTPEDLAAFDAVPEELRAYCAEFAAIDRNVARVRAELRRLGVAQDTLLWYTSDNGPRAPGAAAEHATAGLRGAKGSLWDGGLRVPSLIEWPRVVPPGSRARSLTGSVDVYPTLLELAGAEPGPAQLDGVSLVPVLRGAAFERPGALGFWSPPIAGRVQHGDAILAAQAQGRVSAEEAAPEIDPSALGGPAFAGHAAWIEGRLKLHALPPGAGSSEARHELYDLQADATETTDLAGERPAEVARLRRDLESWQGAITAEVQRRGTP